MRMEDAQSAPRTKTLPAQIDETTVSPITFAGLGTLILMAPFFLNPPLFIALMTASTLRR